MRNVIVCIQIVFTFFGFLLHILYGDITIDFFL